MKLKSTENRGLMSRATVGLRVAAGVTLPYLWPMKFLDEARVYIRSGDGGNGGP